MIQIGFISLNIIIILLLLVFILFITIKKGKRLLISLILAIYPSLLIFENFPYITFKPGLPEAVGFLVLYAILVFIFYKNTNKKLLYTTSRKIIDSSLLSLSYIVLMISISSKVLPSLQNLYGISGFLPQLINKIDYGLILIIPIVIIMLTNKSDNL